MTARYEGPLPRLQALIEISRALARAQSQPGLLRRILDLGTRHVGAERGTLYELDPVTGVLTATLLHGEDERSIRLEAGQGLAGTVASTGQAIRIADAYADPRFDRSVDARTGYRTRSMLIVPLRGWDDTVVGVLQVLNKIEGEFDADDEAFLAAFGAQAAVALETARLHEERVHEERLAAVGQVVATLVHDMRGPLTGLNGYAGLIAQKPPDDLHRKCVEGIYRTCKRLGAMVGSILKYVRGDAHLLLAKVSLDELADEALADAEAAFHDRDLTWRRLGEPVGAARVDALALRRALDNLLRNAAEATGTAGVISLWVEHAGEGRVRMLVGDEGPGLPAEIREHLFEPFQSVGKSEGTGLGLYTVREVVEAHEGDLVVESPPGGPTRIGFALPISGPAQGT